MAANNTPSAITEAQLDAGIAAWFGVTKARPTRAILRERMHAAVAAVSEAGAPDVAWRDMATAPKDGSLLRLLVNFEHHATEDAEGPQVTIGSNTWDNHHDFDEWQFAGWNWEQDCFTQGIGTPVGWLPLLNTSTSTPEAVLNKAARDVLAERLRQISVEGWTPEHDDEHGDGSLAKAAAAYAAQSLAADDAELECGPPSWWPWDKSWWKPSSRRRMLVKANALILAEIERLDRASLRVAEMKGGA